MGNYPQVKMVDILQTRQYPQPGLFDADPFFDKAKMRMDSKKLATLDEALQQRHRQAVHWGGIFFSEMLKGFNKLQIPENMAFIIPKCAQLGKMLAQKDQWPSDNAIGWIEKFVQRAEERGPQKGNGILGGVTAEQLDTIRLNLKLFKYLREVDGYIIRGDKQGFGWAVAVLRAYPPESAERATAFFADS